MLHSDKIRIKATFFVFLGMTLLMGKGDVLWAVVCAVICHEIGHLIALSLVGIHVKQISFTAVGVKIQADTRYLSYGREIFCVLAGPLSNILLAVVLARTMHAYLLAGTNLMQGVFNLLPVSGLDGIRILHLLVSWGIDPITADQVCRIVGGFCGGVLTVVTAYLFFQHRTGLFLSLSALGMFWNALRNPDGK